jgi:hypothetical protein
MGIRETLINSEFPRAKDGVVQTFRSGFERLEAIRLRAFSDVDMPILCDIAMQWAFAVLPRDPD